jgi:hypothetical protein
VPAHSRAELSGAKIDNIFEITNIFQKKLHLKAKKVISLSLNPLSEPHAEEAVVDGIGTIVLIDVLAVGETLEGSLDAAEGWQAVLLYEGLCHGRLDAFLLGYGEQECCLIGSH